MGWVIKDLGKVISFLLNLLGYGDKLNYFHNGCFVFYGMRKITVKLFSEISFTVEKTEENSNWSPYNGTVQFSAIANGFLGIYNRIRTKINQEVKQ